MKRNSPEHAIQCAFIEWVRWNETKHPALLLSFACPNGGQRHPAVAAKLKAEGARAGVPDWLLPVANSEHIGLAIEFKAPKGQVSNAQAGFINLLRAGGWFVEVCRSVECGIAVTTHYLAKLTPEQRAAIVRQVYVT